MYIYASFLTRFLYYCCPGTTDHSQIRCPIYELIDYTNDQTVIRGLFIEINQMAISGFKVAGI